MDSDTGTSTLALLGSDEPPPIELVNADGRSSAVLVCDHASNKVAAPALDPTSLI
jgi:predicted N-formylglutamate amidohydrolase